MKEHVLLKGIIIGYTWYGHRAYYPVQQERVDEPMPSRTEDLQELDGFGFQDITGGILLIYPYKEIDNIPYLAQQYTDTILIGDVKEEDEDRFFSSPELWT